MPDALSGATRFLRALQRSRGARSERTRFGEALFVRSLPHVWYLNFLSVDPGVGASAAELADDAEAAHAAAGLRHRKIAIHDDGLGTSVAAGFRELGWAVEPLVLMAFAGDGAKHGSGEARRVARGTLEPLWLRGMRDAGMADGEAQEIVAAKAVNERACRVDYFAAFVDGSPASYCELYSRDGVGQVEAVLTLPEHRGRGLASSVVLGAAAASGELGNELTFLLAEEDDWPKELYARLGFETAGRIWDFIRRPPEATPAA